MALLKKMNKHRGLATVEMAIVLGLLLLLIVGGLEFALQFYVRHTMANAAREGARYLAISGGTETQAETVAQSHLTGINATFTVTANDAAPGQTDVTVSISVPVSDISLGMIPHADDATIKTFTTMRKESQ